MNVPGLPVVWYRGGERFIPPVDDDDDGGRRGVMADGQPRVTFECTPTSWYRIIIRDVSLKDQAVYYATFEGKSTSIALVIEGGWAWAFTES
jgi:hypothetical protein